MLLRETWFRRKLGNKFTVHALPSREKPIRNLVMRLHHKDMGVLREKSTWDNLFFLIPYPDNENLLWHVHDRKLEKVDCNLVR